MNDNKEYEVEEENNEIEENDKYNNTISIILRLLAKLFLIIGIILIIFSCFTKHDFTFEMSCIYFGIFGVISISLFSLAEIITLLQGIKDELNELRK